MYNVALLIQSHRLSLNPPPQKEMLLRKKKIDLDLGFLLGCSITFEKEQNRRAPDFQ